MKKNRINIIIILFIVILLPGVLFSIYEFGSLKKNEQIISDIYNDQLETVLNSINQYSDDVIRNWAEEINRSHYAEDAESKFYNFLSLNYQVKAIILTDSSTSDFSFIYNDTVFIQSINTTSIKSLISRNKVITKKLQTYLNTGYRKIEPIKYAENPKLSLFIFAVSAPGANKKICAILLNSEQFIRDILGPRMQVLTKDQIVISAYLGNSKQEVYSSDIYKEKIKPELIKPLWLLPDYHLGISMRGETIKELAQRRSEMNITLTIILDVILLVALFYIYRSIKRELQLVQLKSEFISNVSHEIRTPLSLINMYIETLEMNRVKTDKKKLEYYKVISQETKRLSGIVNKILNFSRIDSGKKRYKMEMTNLNTIADKVLDTYKHHLKSEGFGFTYYPDKKSPAIIGDPEAISDAIINLLENAIKYSKEEKHIELRTGTSSDEVYIEVKDKGIGIPANEQSMIFEKFYRITEGSLAYASKGTGLGLSIVKHIIDAHKGQVSVISEVGKGSTFRLSFPLSINKNN